MFRQRVHRLTVYTLFEDTSKLENHYHAQAFYFTYYNWVRLHKSLGNRTPAQAAGLAECAFDMRWIVELIDARAPKPKRGPYKSKISK